MIVVASGHAGVDGFVRQLESHDVELANTWAEVIPLWQGARKVLLGENLRDFESALEWLRQHPSDRTVLLWVSADTSLPEWLTGQSAIHVWRGEIDGDALRAWCRESPQGLEGLPPMWSVVSLFPYPSAGSLVRALTSSALGRYGRNGLWVDNDWGLASLSLAVAAARLQRVEVPGKLRPLQTGWGLLIPAAPPWLPGMARPGLDEIRGWLRGEWNWQGWWLGGKLADERTAEILSHMSTVLFWGTAMTPQSAFARTRELVHLYQPHVECWMVSEDSEPPWVSQEGQLVRAVSLIAPAVGETPQGSGSKWWDKFRQKKGAAH